MFLPKKHTTVYPAIHPAGPLKHASIGKVVIVAGAGRGIGKVWATTNPNDEPLCHHTN
jgi:hypothetical protein